VEVINILRPTVAVSRYVIFAALALHRHPEYRGILRAGGQEDLENFVHEVRRFYPFFPFVAARVRKSFEWKGYFFPEGTRVLLDLYGTNHDPRTWEAPQEFRPERFRRWDKSAWNFIPQGGGDHYENHRCAGEWITIELMKVAVRHLCRSMTYEVPMQNLQIRFSRIPAIPESRFVIKNVRRCPDPAP
jgi:fatty-acid peroxygenase